MPRLKLSMTYEELEKDFWNHVEIGKFLPKQAPDVMLIAYGYFKQASEGDNMQERPTANGDIVRTFMHDQWMRLKGMSKEEAMTKYIEYIQYLKQEEAKKTAAK